MARYGWLLIIVKMVKSIDGAVEDLCSHLWREALPVTQLEDEMEDEIFLEVRMAR